MYIKNLHQIILHRTTKENLLSGSLSCVDFKDIFSTLEFQLWMGEPISRKSHMAMWTKSGMKGKKENKNKRQQSGFDPLCVKIPPTH